MSWYVKANNIPILKDIYPFSELTKQLKLFGGKTFDQLTPKQQEALIKVFINPSVEAEMSKWSIVGMRGNNQPTPPRVAMTHSVYSDKDNLSMRLPWPVTDAGLIGLMAGAGSGPFLLPLHPALPSGDSRTFDDAPSLRLLRYLPTEGKLMDRGNPHDVYPLMPEVWAYVAHLHDPKPGP